jgi:hypothetical protein
MRKNKTVETEKTIVVAAITDLEVKTQEEIEKTDPKVDHRPSEILSQISLA